MDFRAVDLLPRFTFREAAYWWATSLDIEASKLDEHIEIILNALIRAARSGDLAFEAVKEEFHEDFLGMILWEECLVGRDALIYLANKWEQKPAFLFPESRSSLTQSTVKNEKKPRREALRRERCRGVAFMALQGDPAQSIANVIRLIQDMEEFACDGESLNDRTIRAYISDLWDKESS